MVEQTPEQTRHATPFAEEAQAAIQQLRHALGGVLEDLPLQSGARATRLADTLQIDNQLAWKITKILSAHDCFLASQYVPGAAGVRIFLRAAAKRSVADAVIKRAQQAFDRFRMVMKEHAGDRKSASAMLAAHVTEDRARLDLMHRKGAFNHLSYIWGVQSRAHLHSYIINTSSCDRRIDVATIRGFVDLRWIRPNVPWRISRFYTVDAHDRMQTRFERTPLCPPAEMAGADHQLPLLPQFCSQPLPRVRRVDGEQGEVTYQLVEGSVGNAGVLTCVMGEFIRAAEPRFCEDDHRHLAMMVLPRTPCETLVVDIIIHRNVLGRLAPQADMFADLFDQAFDRRPADLDRLPLHEGVEYRGGGSLAVQTPDVPRYPEMIRFAFDRLGWPDAEFDVYRLQIPYPPIPTAIRILQELPEAPTSGPRAG